jgi:uncharacterized protein (DUF1499 family)
MSDKPSFVKRLARPLLNNEVDTEDESGWYPEIEPRRYRASADDVLDAVVSVIEARDRWRLVEFDRDTPEVSAEVHTKRMDFVDDLTVRMEHDDPNVIVVHARSESRVGKGDFGQNARTIRELFERLDDELGA